VQAQALLAQLQHFGYTRAAVIHTTGAYGRGGWHALQSLAAAAAVTLYEVPAVDADAPTAAWHAALVQFQQQQNSSSSTSSRAPVRVFVVFCESVVEHRVYEALHAAALYGRGFVFFNSEGSGQTQQLSASRDATTAASGTLQLQLRPELLSYESQTFQLAHTARFGGGIDTALGYAPWTHDAAMAIAHALQGTNATSRTNDTHWLVVTAAMMRNVSFAGATGAIHFGDVTSIENGGSTASSSSSCGPQFNVLNNRMRLAENVGALTLQKSSSSSISSTATGDVSSSSPPSSPQYEFVARPDAAIVWPGGLLQQPSNRVLRFAMVYPAQFAEPGVLAAIAATVAQRLTGGIGGTSRLGLDDLELDTSLVFVYVVGGASSG
jgi:hypothetical protein